MSLFTRSATIQVRVVPRVKQASEEILVLIGLTMSEAVELFLRRVIVDERIPFELTALETTRIDVLPDGSATGESKELEEPAGMSNVRSSGVALRSGAARKQSKKFLGTPMPGRTTGQKERKNTA